MFRNGFDQVFNASKKLEKVNVSAFNRVNQVLHNHHETEDALWFPKLRRNHPEVKAEIDILEEDHKVLVTLEEKILQGDIKSLSVFIEKLNDHLNREELITLPYLLDGTGGI